MAATPNLKIYDNTNGEFIASFKDLYQAVQYVESCSPNPGDYSIRNGHLKRYTLYTAGERPSSYDEAIFLAEGRK